MEYFVVKSGAEYIETVFYRSGHVDMCSHVQQAKRYGNAAMALAVLENIRVHHSDPWAEPREFNVLSSFTGTHPVSSRKFKIMRITLAETEY
jgi:hypothetical protein